MKRPGSLQGIGERMAGCVLFLLLGLCVAGTAGCAVPLTLAGSPSVGGTDSDLSSLPIEAQYAISAAIGQDVPAYHAARSDGGFLLRNQAHGLRVTFNEGGVSLHADATLWRMDLCAWGYGEAVAAVGDGDVSANENRVAVAHAGITEWYVNGPFGLQQGFTLYTPPGDGRAAPLTVQLELAQGCVARVDEDHRALTLHAADGGPLLRYGGLAAVDASGKRLPAWLEIAGNLLCLRIDDTKATYPVTVDPFIQDAKLVASDGAAGGFLGTSVAISGDTVVVGASGIGNYQGAAYVFERPPAGWSGTLNEAAKLVASDGQAYDEFGDSVAISGDTVVVGASGYDTTGGLFDEQGAAYVFEKPGAGWSGTLYGTAKLVASDGGVLDYCGSSVAISGDTVVVGASGHDVDGSNSQGAAYMFVKPGAGWPGTPQTMSQTTKLTASDGGGANYFGTSVAISGDTIVVGAYGHNGSQGAAYVFEKPGDSLTDINENAKLTASDGVAYDFFGNSVAISEDEDTVVVGAHRHDIGTNADQGAAYVFEKPGVDWSGTLDEDAKLFASDGVADDCFGYSVAVSGDTVVVGAPGEVGVRDDLAQGAAYVFEKPGVDWSGTLDEDAKLFASDGVADDEFGFSAAISGDTVIVGAHYHDIGTNLDQGAAYVFDKPFTPYAPEIVVQGNGISIPDGDTTPQPADGTDFGPVPTAGGSVEHTFTIRNTGTANLTITLPIARTGAAAADFSVTANPATPVAPGGTTTLTVRFAPSATGARTATISITNNDANENPYDFAIQGTGIDKGDVNGDGAIDLIDVRLCLQIAQGYLPGTPTQRSAADVDRDGDVDETDAQILSEYVIGMRSALP